MRVRARLFVCVCTRVRARVSECLKGPLNIGSRCVCSRRIPLTYTYSPGVDNSPGAVAGRGRGRRPVRGGAQRSKPRGGRTRRRHAVSRARGTPTGACRTTRTPRGREGRHPLEFEPGQADEEPERRGKGRGPVGVHVVLTAGDGGAGSGAWRAWPRLRCVSVCVRVRVRVRVPACATRSLARSLALSRSRSAPALPPFLSLSSLLSPSPHPLCAR